MSVAKLGEFLTVRQVAEVLNLKECTIRAWVLARRLAYVRIGRRALRIPVAEIERLISQGTVPTRERR